MAERLEPSLSNRAPIFVLCCERSGSTLLRYLIDAHPEICCPGELHLARTCASWYHAVFHGFLQCRPVTPAQRHRLAVQEARRAVSEVMSQYALEKGKAVWCEKSVLTVDFLGLTAEVFPDARFLCLYRNAADTMHSALEVCRLGWWPGIQPFVARTPDNFLDGLADFWASKVGRILAFERENPGRCHRIRFEDLVQRPGRTLEGMFAFLGVPPAPEVQRRAFSVKHDAGPGDPKITSASRIDAGRVGAGAGLPLDRLSGDRVQLINALHAEVGYAPVAGRGAGARLSSKPS